MLTLIGSIKLNEQKIHYSIKVTTQNNIVFLKGRNGSGKTTCFKILADYYNNFEGFKNHNFKYTFFIDSRFLFSNLSVKENLKLYEKDQKLIQRWIDFFEANDLIEKNSEELSAGEIQKINLVKTALIINKYQSSLILVDEPFSHLDLTYLKRVLKKIQKLKLFEILKVRKSLLMFSAHQDLTHFLDQKLIQKMKIINLEKKE